MRFYASRLGMILSEVKFQVKETLKVAKFTWDGHLSSLNIANFWGRIDLHKVTLLRCAEDIKALTKGVDVISVMYSEFL